MTSLSRKTLSAALKGVRKHRSLTVLQVAKRMGLAKRTYEYFEGLKGGLPVDQIHGFAQATDSDAWAILISALIGAPDLATACADSKAMTIFFLALGRAEPDLREALTHLSPREVTRVFDAAFADLIAAGRAHRAASGPPSDRQATPPDAPPQPPEPSDPDRRG